MEKSPAELGYRMPAEWEKHAATWVSWPKDPATFPPEVLPAVEAAYVSMVEALGASEEVRILVDDPASESRVKGMIRGGVDVSFHQIRTVDVWVRDYSPIYVKGRDLALVKWVFNSWGNKYEELKADNESGERMAAASGLRVFRPGLVLEGGSIDVNGLGTLLTSEQCLLNPNRNPGFDRPSLQRALEEYLGVSKVVWLKAGILGDDTDGHVDDVARFVGPRKVVLAHAGGWSDPNLAALEEDRRVLEAARDQDGRPLDIVTVPMPRRISSGGVTLPASHINFYVGNATVLVPTFGGESDAAALQALGDAFPDRTIAGIDCRSMVHGLGATHCVTQQVPVPPSGASLPY
jgi:agmatine deiminase